MPRNMAISLFLMLGAVMYVNAMDFDCTTLLGSGLTVEDSEQIESFKLDVHRVNDSMPTSIFRAGGRLTVVIVGDYPIDTFVLQARVPLDEKPVGRWQTTSTQQTTFSCQDGGADTVTNAEGVEVQRVEAMWIAPESETLREIEFIASVKNEDGKFWHGFHSILVEFEETQSSQSPDSAESSEPAVDTEGEEGQSVESAESSESSESPKPAVDTDGEEVDSDDDPREEEGARKDNEDSEEEARKPEGETQHGETPNTGEDPTEPERNDEEEKKEADARDEAGEHADREEEAREGDHDYAIEAMLGSENAEKERELAEAEARTGETYVGEAARNAAKAKEEIEKEKQMYEKYMYDTEMERERRMEEERRDKEEYEIEQQKLREEMKGDGDDEIDDSILTAGSNHVVSFVYGTIIAVIMAILLL